jgi:hypothetical protein
MRRKSPSVGFSRVSPSVFGFSLGCASVQAVSAAKFWALLGSAYSSASARQRARISFRACCRLNLLPCFVVFGAIRRYGLIFIHNVLLNRSIIFQNI